MVKNCDIKHPTVFWLYYPYRHWIGLKSLWCVLKREKEYF